MVHLISSENKQEIPTEETDQTNIRERKIQTHEINTSEQKQHVTLLASLLLLFALYKRNFFPPVSVFGHILSLRAFVDDDDGGGDQPSRPHEAACQQLRSEETLSL